MTNQSYKIIRVCRFSTHKVSVEFQLLNIFFRFTMIIQNCLKNLNMNFKTRFHESPLTLTARKTKQDFILSAPLFKSGNDSSKRLSHSSLTTFSIESIWEN